MGCAGASGNAASLSEGAVHGAGGPRPPDHGNSQEVDMGTLLRMFGRAVWWGSLAGAAPGLLFTIPLGISAMGGTDPVSGLLVALLPLLVTVTIVIGASLLIGLPITAILSHNRRERQRDYAVAGLAAGASIPTLIILAIDGLRIEPMLFFTVPGMIAGTMTGLVWGNWREALADEAASADA